MNKMNKKGFTLIEMLVVIAIIAVLVSIIIPVVSNSTEKAAAAANAANLRSLKAEAITAAVGQQTSTTNLTLTYTNGKLTAIAATSAAPEAKACGTVSKGATLAFEINSTTGDIKATYGGKDIKYFAGIAETGTAAS